MPCIYKITNTVNGKVYIGQTAKTAKIRFGEHRRMARYKKNNSCSRLYCAMNKYGEKSFIVETIEECSEDKLNEREMYWIAEYDSFKNGYNCTLGGEGHKNRNADDYIKLWNDGFLISEISRKTHSTSDTVKGYLISAGISEIELKERFNAYTKENNPFKGKKHTQESLLKMSEAQKRRDPSTFRGGAHTVEGKIKAAEKFKRTYWSKSEEVRKEISRKSAEKRKGKCFREITSVPEETRKKISETLKKKHLCPPHAIKVYCKETDTIYRSMTEAEEQTGIDRHIIKQYVEGKRKDNRFHFELIKMQHNV